MKWPLAVAATLVLAIPVGVGGCADRHPPDRAARLQTLLDRLVHDAAVPGAQLVLTRDGRDLTLTSGVADTSTGAAFPDAARARIASNTKTFVASVVLQLVAQRRVELDAPVARYLPVAGPGGDGRAITVRNLLQHTSAIPDYLTMLDLDFVEALTRDHSIGDLIRLGLDQPATFAPGVSFAYSNTNYLLAGQLIERVTGTPVDVEVTQRIINPLGLRDTYWPRYPAEAVIRGPHPRAYLENDGGRTDITDIDPNGGLPDGAMISTGHDLNRFFLTLLSGAVVPPAQLAEMRRTVADPHSADRVGLGLFGKTTASGVEVWGHGGSIPGFYTAGGAAPDRAITIILNQVPAESSSGVDEIIDALVDEATRP
ncbi:serine hydrolase domain-containing protein [Nocardia pseudobrasiliensis]|uniref:D-alanyl-D-alanine carboxypeptidase n=1 Tax=Nocardia pseudobrasiliensis TaxID=45979 RepID=A0A370IBS2_9NOCA|nr:serine hydrolase domain-containing protein [Nocardia pseudobrasiliensis]RDI68178.1 D-alanyl-D-alanine carboxypeptidase [Nocardia pseudobrasiliensis]